MAFMPIRLRSSCSGSAAQHKKVETSFASWDVVGGVPSEYLDVETGWGVQKMSIGR